VSHTRRPPSILLVTSNYPSAAAPHRGTFVHGLAREFAGRGAPVEVIAPRSRWEGPAGDAVLGADEPPVLRPRFTSLSNKRLGPFSTFSWTVGNFSRAVRRAARRLPFDPQLAYGHFLFPGGEAALREARRRGIPSVVALGESQLDYYRDLVERKRSAETLLGFSGILSVSAANRDYCVRELGIPEERIEVVANAADSDTFHPRDRAGARRRLALPPERPIVAFCGHFIERKGPLRLLRALAQVPEAGAVFLGEGPQQPAGPQVLFAGRVPHAEVPEWLSACDLFVLPTLAEGSPNAVAEAVACGLPVVASDIPALREAVDPEAALLVDPRDESALGAAIGALIGDAERRRRMGEAALRIARRYTLSDRAGRILDWLVGIVERDRVARGKA
jgi:teichuronic acid biosynthesis glycosyltransferase TuaC